MFDFAVELVNLATSSLATCNPKLRWEFFAPPGKHSTYQQLLCLITFSPFPSCHFDDLWSLLCFSYILYSVEWNEIPTLSSMLQHAKLLLLLVIIWFSLSSIFFLCHSSTHIQSCFSHRCFVSYFYRRNTGVPRKREYKISALPGFFRGLDSFL